MDQSLFKFDLIAEDPTTHARAGVLHTPHGDIETPIFMPVGTKANVKGIPTETVKQLGAQIVLANTYHLSMRPGEDTIAELGGLHKFMNWHGPILTDSGGFQVFSHNDAVKLTDEGVRFIVNDYDGRHVFWTPEDNMEIAMKLGSDICMQLVKIHVFAVFVCESDDLDFLFCWGTNVLFVCHCDSPFKLTCQPGCHIC